MVEEALRELSPVFDEMYADSGRPSIPPERLLKSLLLIAFYSVRSERMFVEQLRYNLLFRWFLGMEMTEKVFDASSFSKNRERLLAHDVAGQFFRGVLASAKGDGYLSSEHFSVDGTLIEAWASMKSFRPKGESPDDDPKGGGDGNRWVDFSGKKRSNETHQSTTDPDARLARKGPGREAKLSYSANVLIENGNGLIVDVDVRHATGTAERDAALHMIERLDNKRRITLGADRGYDTKGFVQACRQHKVTPHVSKKRKYSAIDGRTTRHGGYVVSQRFRKRIEEVFGWFKTVGGIRRTRYRGMAKNQMAAYFVGAAYNLIRMTKLKELPT